MLRLCHIQRGLLQSDCQALPQIELVEADRLSLAAELLDEVEGDTVSEVLSYVEYEPKRLLEKFKARAERAVKEHGATLGELKELVSTYRDSLRGYTYYESD